MICTPKTTQRSHIPLLNSDILSAPYVTFSLLLC
uniref:Uncharacterized protein n=1 Tax=Triticum urartu TaxID=4572 RepID=A0A8R7TG96_TRIUA